MLSLVALLVSAQGAPPPPSAQPPSQPAACADEAFAQFDFWVGEWEVFANGSETMVARSSIERLYNGCAIRENWMPLQGQPGGSLNSFDPVTGRWHQKWVGGRGRVDFEGGEVDGTMVLNGYWPDVAGPGRTGIVRMRFSQQEDGSVRQLGEVSLDHGLTWSPSFDLIYRKPAATAAVD